MRIHQPSTSATSKRYSEISLTNLLELVNIGIGHAEWLKILKNKQKNINRFAIDKITKKKQFDVESIEKAFSKDKAIRGNLRPITAPKEDWKKKLELILSVLDIAYQDSGYSTGFKSLHSIYDNASKHKTNKHTFMVDIQNAFGSITYSRVKDIFKNLGYSGEKAHNLARFCTLNGSAPQGFPTSPKLLNICMKKLDIRLGKYIEKRKGSYTRYADDLTFSRNKPFTQKEIDHILHIILSEGWSIARNKLHLTKQRYITTTGVLMDKHKGKTFMKTANKKHRRILSSVTRHIHDKKKIKQLKTPRDNALSLVISGQTAYELVCKGHKSQNKSFKRWSKSVEADRLSRHILNYCIILDLIDVDKSSFKLTRDYQFTAKRANFMFKVTGMQYRFRI